MRTIAPFAALAATLVVPVLSFQVGQMDRLSSSSSLELLNLRQVTPAPAPANTLLAPPRRPPAKRPENCPPCFNCLLPAFSCSNGGECNPSDGQCKCPAGFGGQDCSDPLCGALPDGDARHPRAPGELCECRDGWGGINCNVCKDDSACRSFNTRFPGEDDGMVCYRGGLAIEQNFQMCDVTNRKIIDTIPDNKPPQVTFTCAASYANDTLGLMSGFQPSVSPDLDHGECSFQFWVDRIESFYCNLKQCSWQLQDGATTNKTSYQCKEIECACLPDRFLCGENGSVNIDDFLAEEVKGPGSFDCESGKGCAFREPAMDQLINDIFGDKAIYLDCDSGECVHHTQVPGYSPPSRPTNGGLVAFSAAMAALVFVVACLAIWYIGHTRRVPEDNIKLPEDEAARLMTDHVPATLHFSNITYELATGKQVLSNVTGTVRPGELLAIMGASGAGKSTLLDILAHKAKTGVVSGEIFINGREIPDEATFRRVVGFVDQEDTLLPTLTVYETVLYSALLRLPRDMSYEAKVFRTLETMNELGILDIKDSRIGESGKRSISGGEKRRVSIACELVTGPSMLFLDEPTSGLDSYNAYNVVESLKTLASTFNRTVIFTIHQPQSNIVSLFDRLLLLAKGQLVYSGLASKASEHFANNGHKCPAGYNIADYLIDVTVSAAGEHRSKTNNGAVSETGSTDVASGTSDRVPQALADLVLASRASDEAKIVEAEIGRIHSGLSPSGTETRNVTEETELLRGYKTATIWTQFRVLSRRAFINLYRNPLLMATHYIVAVVAALFCGFFFYHVSNDIPGFQNRLGLFLFILSLFGFSTLSSLGIFANERVLFMRERANGYYAPIAYFLSKVLFDIVPLRVIPPFILGSIVYGLAGLNAEVSSFWKFIMTLVLFNLTASSIVLFISVAVADHGVANLLGSLVMLYNLLFAGLLMNYDRVPHGLKWMQTLSFFHAGYEALLVNELRYLQLVEHKFGLDIQVPSATILSSFGFHAQAFWWPDTALLGIVFGIFTLASFLVLQFFVKEKR